jgi:predicted oxidoreductase
MGTATGTATAGDDEMQRVADSAEVRRGLVDSTARRIGVLECGPIGFGCWRFTDADPGRSAALLEAAIEAGMTLVDNADVYGLDWGGSGWGTCEENLGAALAHRPGLRDRIVLATKGGIVPGVPYVSDPAYLVAACEASLRRLGVDHVDLYQIHRPDPFTHPAAVAHAFESLRERGLVREFGVSNHTPSQTAALQAHLPFPLASTQPELSVIALQSLRDGTLDQCAALGITPLAWSPLAGGRLATGDGVRPELVAVLDRLADREGVTRAAVAIAFVLAHPSRPVAIVGTQQPARLAELAAATSVHLDRRDVYDLIVASDGVPLP